jgi:hypothetical protein
LSYRFKMFGETFYSPAVDPNRDKNNGNKGKKIFLKKN